MSTRTIKYVQYWYLDLRVSGPGPIKEITTRNKKSCTKWAAASMVSFQFFDITVTDGVRSERHNVSPMYYIDAVLLNADTIKALPGNHTHLFEDMKRRGLDVLLQCRTGLFVEPPSSYVMLSTA